MYDLIIIGAGPAGITASVYAARKKINTLVITRDIGGQAAWSGDIENYTGYQFITGPELAAKFEEHMRKFDIQLKENAQVSAIEKTADKIIVKSEKNIYEAKALIVASGKRTRDLNVSGEKEFKNKGVSYCATCDAPLFAGKDVAVIGGGNSALDAAVQLGRIAKKIYLINNTAALGGDAVMRNLIEADKKTVIFNNSEVKEIAGAKLVEAIKIKVNGEEKLLPVQGVFVEIGLIPNSEFAGILEKNKSGEIKVNSYNQTNIEGIFAAGDVTDVPEKQIIIAAGEGSKAALRAFQYLIQHG